MFGVRAHKGVEGRSLVAGRLSHPPTLPPPHLPPPRLWDWLKLEDINVSLYFVTWVW